MHAMSDLFSNGGAAVPPTSPLAPLGTVYFAFKPEPDFIDQVVSLGDRLRARYGLMGKVSPSVLHMTVCAIGYLPALSDERVEQALRVADSLVAKPFEIVLDRVRTYPNGQVKPPLVAFADSGMPRADLFRHALIADLRRGGFIFPMKLPDPHMTLFYDRRIVIEEPIDPIRWIVRDFVLIHSIYGEGRHVPLGQWPLRG